MKKLLLGVITSVIGFLVDEWLIELITGWDLVTAINVLHFTSLIWIFVAFLFVGMLLSAWAND